MAKRLGAIVMVMVGVFILVYCISSAADPSPVFHQGNEVHITASSTAIGASSDVQKIEGYTSLTCRLEEDSKTMHRQMIHALFGYIASKNKNKFVEFKSDFEQDDSILRRLSAVQAPTLANTKAEGDMLQVAHFDRAWGKGARHELHQLLRIGRTLTAHQYFEKTKQEDANGTSLSNRSTMFTFAALREEGLSAQQIETAMMQAVAKSGNQ